MNKILDIVEDIKQNITDNQYKTIMESLMEINNKDKIPLLTNNQERYKFVCLFNWLDKKLEITEYRGHSITRSELQKYVITNYFDCRYYENIDFVKQILKIYFSFSTKEQNNSYEYQFVKYRD
jgi:predicted S18 family serine protease